MSKYTHSAEIEDNITRHQLRTYLEGAKKAQTDNTWTQAAAGAWDAWQAKRERYTIMWMNTRQACTSSNIIRVDAARETVWADVPAGMSTEEALADYIKNRTDIRASYVAVDVATPKE